MLRKEMIDKYGELVYAAVNDMFDACNHNRLADADVLLCSLNGFRSWDNHLCIGLGEEGQNSIQGFNSALACGLPNITDDINYFDALRKQNFNGISDFENTLHQEMSRYLAIWENTHIIRILIQLSHIVNGEHYDWNLNVGKQMKLRGQKSNVIEVEILKAFVKVQTFEDVLNIAYNREIRNGIAHSQCVLCQYGIVLMDPRKSDNPNPPGVTFEDWERIFLYSYFLVKAIYENLHILSDKSARLSIMHKMGIPIMVPNLDDTEWSECKVYPYFYPQVPDPIWRFTKPSWAID